MNSLRKKLILLAFLSFLYPVNVSAGLEDDYERQQQGKTCNSENADFISQKKDSKYCVDGKYWIEYSSKTGVRYSSGVLNKTAKSLFGRIKKIKLEGNLLVEYSCSGEFLSYSLSCNGPAKREVLAIKTFSWKKKNLSKEEQLVKQRQIEIKKYQREIDQYTQKIEYEPNNWLLYNNRGVAKRNLLHTQLKRKAYINDDDIGMCSDFKKAKRLGPSDDWYADANIKNSCQQRELTNLKKEDQLVKRGQNPLRDQNPISWYEKIAGFELDIRRLTQTINTNPRRSRLSDLYIARGNSKRRLLETKLKRKLTNSDDNIGMCTDYKMGLALFSKPSNYTNKPPSYIKKILKEYCKLSFWESIKFSFK